MKKINQGFVCICCWERNPPARWTCRNHCRKCFVSLHLDDKVPGDRASICGWKMVPVDYIIKWDEIKIKFICERCWKIHWNKAADDDNIRDLPQIVWNYKLYY